MPNSAGPMRAYKDRCVVEEDELSFDALPGNVTRWIGGFKWSVPMRSIPNLSLPHFRRFSRSMLGNGWVECLQKNVEGKYYVELIYFKQGKQLQFDKVRQ